MRKTRVISANSCWNIVNFRLGLIAALRAHAIVAVMAPEMAIARSSASSASPFVPMPMNSSGVSVLDDSRLFAVTS